MIMCNTSGSEQLLSSRILTLLVNLSETIFPVAQRGIGHKKEYCSTRCRSWETLRVMRLHGWGFVNSYRMTYVVLRSVFDTFYYYRNCVCMI